MVSIPHSRQKSESPAAGVSLTSPAAVIGALPHLVGFPPEHSLVVLVVSGGLLRVTARTDLPSAGSVPSQWSAELVGRLHPRAGETAILVVFPTDLLQPGAELPHRPVVDAVSARLESRGCAVTDALVTVDGRWWSYLCANERCCPPEGRVVSTPDESLARTRLVYAGLAPVPSRAAMVAEFEDIDLHTTDAVDRERRRRRESTRRGHRAPRAGRPTRGEWATHLSSLITSTEQPSPVDVLDILEGLCDVRLRDTVLWDMSIPGPSGIWRRATVVLRSCLRAAEGDEVPPVATVLAVAFWLLGDGARAREALRRAETADPGYRLAELIATAVDHGLSPDVWRLSMQGLDRRDCLGSDTSALERGA